jgi:hypothetical protein
MNRQDAKDAKKCIFATDENQMDTDKTQCNCISICVHLIYICG